MSKPYSCQLIKFLCYFRITKEGSRNAQLITIIYAEDERNCNEDLEKEGKHYDFNLETSVCHSNPTLENSLQSRQNSADKLVPTVLTLSNEVLQAAMDCRQNFQNATRTNYMYDDSTQLWITVDR